MMGQVNVSQLREMCILGDIYVAMSADMFDDCGSSIAKELSGSTCQ